MIRSARNRVLTFLLTVVLLSLPAGPAAAQTVTLSIDQAYVVAEQAVVAGDTPVATALARGLLQRDPQDFRALTLLTAALIGSGDWDEAARNGRLAYRAAAAGAQRMNAARLVATAHFRTGNLNRAQWWLRRAANDAETPQQAAQVARDFQNVKRRNPFSAALNFSLTPSSNINGGSSEKIFYLGDIPFVLSPDSLALSGFEISAGVDLSYRVSQGPRHLTQLDLRLFTRNYVLTKETRASVPDAKGSDYALTITELALNHRAQLFDGLGPSGISAMIGQNWYGGDPLWRYGRISLSQDFPLGPKATATIRGYFETEKALADSASDSRVYDLEASVGQRLANGDLLQLSLGSRRTDAKRDTSDNRAQRASLRYAFAKPVLNTRLSLDMGLSRKDYDTYSLSADGRHDSTVSLGATAVFPKISYFGFSPSLTVAASRTTSNISRFSSDSLSARLALQSNF